MEGRLLRAEKFFSLYSFYRVGSLRQAQDRFIFYSFAYYSDDLNYNTEPCFKLWVNGMEIGRRNEVKWMGIVGWKNMLQLKIFPLMLQLILNMDWAKAINTYLLKGMYASNGMEWMEQIKSGWVTLLMLLIILMKRWRWWQPKPIMAWLVNVVAVQRNGTCGG